MLKSNKQNATKKATICVSYSIESIAIPSWIILFICDRTCSIWGFHWNKNSKGVRRGRKETETYDDFKCTS